MGVVKIELDRERAANEAVRAANFAERRPAAERTANDKEGIRELREKDGLINLLKNAPLVGSTPPPPPPPVEPEPEPDPTPPGAKPFLDMKVIADWYGTNANTGDITNVSGGIKLHVPNDHEAGSHSGNPRAELLTRGQFVSGDELWLRTAVTLPGPVPSGWMTLCSFFNGGGSIAPWHLSCVGGKFGWQSAGSPNPVPNGALVWQEPVTLGKKIEILHHHTFGSSVQLETWLKIEGKDSGWRMVWGAANGKTATWTSGNNQSPNYYKNCVYYQKGTCKDSKGNLVPAEATFGETLLGDTRASVGG